MRISSTRPIRSTNLSPQQSWNYQLGSSWQTKALSLSADVYYIDFKNLIGFQTIAGNTVFSNQGGVTRKGIEAEATGYLGMGVSLYANGSLNSAKNKQTGLWVQDAPDATATAGVIYNLQGWYASLLDKWVGKTYRDNGSSSRSAPSIPWTAHWATPSRRFAGRAGQRQAVFLQPGGFAQDRRRGGLHGRRHTALLDPTGTRACLRLCQSRSHRSPCNPRDGVARRLRRRALKFGSGFLSLATAKATQEEYG